MDIETTKIANVFESPVAGVLRKKVVQEGETVPVGALLGVVSEPGVPDAEVEKFVGEFLANFKPPEKGSSGGPTPEFVDVGGKRIRYLKAGPDEGTPIILIHGFGADHLGWMFNQAELAADRPVYAIDLPGHGGSSKEVGDGATRDLAKAVTDFMDAKGIASAHLVGHSLGGAVATLIAAKSPERVAALTLIAPGGLGPEIASDFIEGFIAETRARKLQPVLEMLTANPALDHRRHGRGRAEVQTPRRRDRGAPKNRRRELFGRQAARLAARPSRWPDDAGAGDLGRGRQGHPGASTPKACPPM